MSEDQSAALPTEPQEESIHPPDTPDTLMEESAVVDSGREEGEGDAAEGEATEEDQDLADQPSNAGDEQSGCSNEDTPQTEEVVEVDHDVSKEVASEAQQTEGTEEVPIEQPKDSEEAPANQPLGDEETSADQKLSESHEEIPSDQEPSEIPAQEESTTVDPHTEQGTDEEVTQDMVEGTEVTTEGTEFKPGEEFSLIDRRPLSSAVPLEDIIEEEEVVDREELIESVKEALAEQERLSALSGQLEHKIAEYLIARKKTEEKADPGRSVTDQEKRYAQCMAALDRLKLEMRDMEELFQLQELELQVLREEKMAEVMAANAELAEYRKERALTAVHSRSGKKLTSEELDQYQYWEERKEEEVITVRLENIKLQNKIAKLEALIKEKEQLAEGLHMIDFEQLKINNVDLNEKIEERNEDILKLRRKVTSTVQVLTHVKEKLQFLQAENVEKRNKLREMDNVVAKNRDHLTRMKQARDSLRMDNNRLKQRGGLVGHKALLRDYEERKDQNEELASRLDTLQQHHSELSVMCEGLRRKIEQAKTITTHHM